MPEIGVQDKLYNLAKINPEHDQGATLRGIPQPLGKTRRMIRTLPYALLYLLCYLLPSPTYADNGARAFVFPLTGVTVDGDLRDWPATLKRYAVDYYHFGAEADGADDLNAYWQAGYDAAGQSLYLAVSVTDDDYVKTPDNDHYDSHDFQVVYLDFLHTSAPDGVIAYELDEDHRKIVEQERLAFFPQVGSASWEDVEVAIRREGNTVFYEWRIALPRPVEVGQVIGFDYAVFDKDGADRHTEVSWGPGSIKFRSDRKLGDLVLVGEETKLYPLNGHLRRTKEEIIWPPAVTLMRDGNQPFRYTAAVDSTGTYTVTLPAGAYRIAVPSSRTANNWNDIDRIEQVGAPPLIEVGEGTNELPSVEISVAPKPDLIQETGLLQTPFDRAAGRRMDAFVEAYREYYGVPAVSLALLQDGELVYHRTYGVENTVTNAPLRPQAVFEAASITKSVFAYAVNRLVQRGEFDLEQPLHELLPFKELEADYPEYKQMTGRHVLTHVSGLPNWGRRMVNQPGTKLGYSGEGFEYLKRAVARDDGDAWPALTQALLDAEVIGPLGMRNTHFSCNDTLGQLKVAGHYAEVPLPYDCPGEPGVAYSMHTEARDFAPFALALLERKGLTAAQAEAMFGFQTVGDEEDWMNGYQTGFGLGIALRESPYGLVFGHGGNNGDFRCTFEVYDELRSGFIVFTNADTGGPLLFDLAQFLVEGKWEAAE
jgi:CubicO group peptidase (beta-lactamase class C family)